MSNVDLQKNPVEGFSAGLVDDNIYEVNIQDKSIVICFFFQPIAEQFFIFFLQWEILVIGSQDTL